MRGLKIPNGRGAGLVLLALGMVASGSAVVASKVVGASLTPFVATAARFMIVLPILGALAWRDRDMLRGLTRHDHLMLLAQALCGTVAFGVLMLLGTRATSAANASVVVGTLPVVMGALAIAIFGEAPGWRFVLAACIAMTGVGLVVTKARGGGPSMGLGDLIGMALVVAAVLSEAVFMLLNRTLRRPLPPALLVAVMSGLGVILTLPPAVAEIVFGADLPLRADVWLGVLLYAMIPTVAGLLCWYSGTARTSASDASLMAALMPIAALALSVIVLGEAISPAQGAGCLLVVIGVVVGTRRGR